MNSYRVRVQVVIWYELVVSARSRSDVIANAERLNPAHIQAEGKPVEAETGLADPESVRPIDVV
jgi:hypothetical protein